MIIADSIKEVAKDNNIAMSAGECHSITRRVLMRLKQGGYYLRTEVDE